MKVHDTEAAVDVLLQLGPTAVEPSYEHGTVWRIPRNLTRGEVRERIARLPCVFGDINLYPKLELLEAVRSDGTFSFHALEYTVSRT